VQLRQRFPELVPLLTYAGEQQQQEQLQQQLCSGGHSNTGGAAEMVSGQAVILTDRCWPQ
jgi:hypothetical protein